jgi:hypothetical protein
VTAACSLVVGKHTLVLKRPSAAHAIAWDRTIVNRAHERTLKRFGLCRSAGLRPGSFQRRGLNWAIRMEAGLRPSRGAGS